jgi:zinc/manganese transport system permease protein
LNILFGQILGVSNGQLVLLLVLGGGVLLTMIVIYRPLLFASVDPDVAEARGVPVRAVGLIFMFALAITVTEAAQVVGTLLVLSLAITPAAAAHRLSARPLMVTSLSIGLALLAADGGVLLSLAWNVRPSVLITAISFASYLVARIVGAQLPKQRRTAALSATA